MSVQIAPVAPLQTTSMPPPVLPPPPASRTPPSAPVVPPAPPIPMPMTPPGHLPLLQMPSAQTTPQPPQLRGSRVRSKPSSTLPLQSLSRPSQISGMGACCARSVTGLPPMQTLVPDPQMPTPSDPAGPS